MKFLCLALFTFIHINASAQESVTACKAATTAGEACFSFQGRARSYNGTPSIRIWKIGSKHLYSVSQVNEAAKTDFDKVTFEKDLYANFEVCPTEKFKQGHMQHICLQAIHHPKFKNIK